MPLENGYAASLIEMQRDWSLDDVCAVLDRVTERAADERRARDEARRQQR